MSVLLRLFGFASVALLVGGCGRMTRAVPVSPATTAPPQAAVPSNRSEVVLQVNSVKRAREVAFAARAPRLAVIGEDQADIWDTGTWTLLRSLPLEDRPDPQGAAYRACGLSPDGKTLAIARAGEVQFWDVASGRLRRTLEASVQQPAALAWSANGRRLGVAGEILRLWDVDTGVARTIALDRSEAYSGGALDFSRDGRLVASVEGQSVTLYRADTGQKVRAFRDKSGVWGPVALSPDGRSLATGGEDPDWQPGPLLTDEFGNEMPPTEAYYAHELKVKVWDVRTGKRIRLLPGYGGTGGTVLQFTPDGKRLFSGGAGNDTLWDMRTGKAVRTIGNSGPTAMSPDGRLVAAFQDSLTGSGVRIFSVATGKRVATLHAPPQPVTALGFSPDGQTLAAGEMRGLRLWDVRQIRVLSALEGPPSGSDRPLVGFLPDGSLYDSFLNGTFVWDVKTGKRLRALRGPGVRDEIEGVTERQWQLLAPDGKTTVNQSEGPRGTTFEVRDASTDRVRATIPVGLGWLPDVTFSPDGRRIALVRHSGMGPPSQSIAMYDLWTGAKVSETAQTGPAAVTLAFSPDGKALAGALLGAKRMPEGRYVEEHRLVLWDTASGREVRRIVLDRPLWALAYSPDGRMLAAGIGDPSDPEVAMMPEAAVRLYDSGTLKQAAAFTAGPASVRAVAFSPDGITLVAGDEAGRVRLWDVPRGVLLATMVAFPTADGANLSTDWFAEGPDGAVDWSPGASSLVRWRRGNVLYPAKAFEARYRRAIAP